jgi:hypothetical protein
MSSSEVPGFDISPVLGDLLVATIVCTLVIAKLTYELIELPGYRLRGGIKEK